MGNPWHTIMEDALWLKLLVIAYLIASSAKTSKSKSRKRKSSSSSESDKKKKKEKTEKSVSFEKPKVEEHD